VVEKVTVKKESIPAPLLTVREAPEPPVAGSQLDVSIYVIELEAALDDREAALARVRDWNERQK